MQLPQVFFKHFASKNQLPSFYISETLVENIGLSMVYPGVSGQKNSNPFPKLIFLMAKVVFPDILNMIESSKFLVVRDGCGECQIVVNVVII